MIPVLGYDSTWEIPIYTPKTSPGNVTNTTSLFRPTSHIPEAINAAYEQLEDDVPFRVVSAGCSFGPEVDTVLALHNTYGDNREVNITGLDINSDALEIARSGQYNSQAIFDFEDPEEKLALLKKHGFQSRLQKLDVGSYISINAQTVREGHSVQFLLHDLVDAIPIEEPAHLILANNVLYHLPIEKRLIVAGNLANALAVGGILSMGCFMQDYEMVQRGLEEDFGLNWVNPGTPKEAGAYMFRRS